ncbi:23S rRNA (pseudouridine(1915)-N(3))-methyltransferase RlmH [Caldicellulosiruptor morganii]|uniref:Ribosomal RNA large subunit methyltransferase H n=1 Tax=Caldicellulosiruptor morganii TaxID=1387555 RepID=A0ABY7BK11_9FIRM|nr:23S rRNA (pseudouridine(1915)-N(3))-methyltransferase RlmH [Caldicellulosiruptor morganii]WAM33160.1 23S rRNA (pseudouridine(1915)-N(3))-methyltransferase RlmH [Caldicellulosiruptor morganii]
MIKVICVGTVKEKYFKEAIDEYRKRLSKWIKIEEVEIKEEDENRYPNIELLLAKEAEKILKHIKDNHYVIVFDVKGTQLSSEQFAQLLHEKISKSEDVVFVIGGSNGLSDAVKRRANLLISFSRFTFPHQLFRVLVYEQVYRGFTIIKGIKYHK